MSLHAYRWATPLQVLRIDLHGFVGAHFLRRSVADLLAVIEDDDPIGYVHHHAHVVLDQHNRGAVLLVDIENEPAHVLLFLHVHAGHRLVEQQQRRLGGQCAGKLDTLLQSVRQAPYRRLPDVLDLEEIDHLLHLRPLRHLLTPSAPDPYRLLDEAGLHLEVAAGHDVVQHRHALEERDVLERAGDAVGRGVVRAHFAAHPAAECDLALLRAIDAVDHVEHGALARPVGADDRAHLVRANVEADVGERLDAPERKRDVLELEDRVAYRDAVAGGHGGALLRPRRGCQWAIANAALGAVDASSMRKSAATMPLRPSSNFTSVSMC